MFEVGIEAPAWARTSTLRLRHEFSVKYGMFKKNMKLHL